MKTYALLAGLLLAASPAYPVTLNLALDAVRDSGGNYVSTSTLALLLVDSGGNGFGSAAAPGGSLSVGSFFDGLDDRIVWRGDFSGGAEGAFFDSVSFNLGSDIPQNASLAFVWLPEATTSTFSLVSGASYGEFTSANATQFGSSSAWSTGSSNSATYTLNVFTSNNTGLLADNLTYAVRLADASLTASMQVSAVPEPSTYAMFAGVAVLGLAWTARRRRHAT